MVQSDLIKTSLPIAARACAFVIYRETIIDGVSEQIPSWVSPVARALLKAREGDLVKLVLPDGAQVLEVLSVAYPRASAG